MTLPSSGPLTFADIRAELGMTPGASLTIPSDPVRDLIGVPSGSIVLPTDFYSKSVVSQTDSRSTPATSHAAVSYGATRVSGGVLILAWHGSTASNPGLNPTCTVSGVNAPLIVARTNGNGAGVACGVALFTAAPSATSGTVAVSWGGLATAIVALRVVNYVITSATDTAEAAEGGATVSLDIPDKGILIGAVAREDSAAAITWTNLTEQGDDATSGGTRRGWGWDTLMAAQSGRNVTYSPFSSSLGQNAVIAASFAKV